MKRVNIEKRIIWDRFPGFISAVDKIKKSKRKNAAPATHAGIISIASPLKVRKFSVRVMGENNARILLTVRIVKGVRILYKI
jgi:hypothetical protein